MALPAHLPFVLPFDWTMRVDISKQAPAKAQSSESPGCLGSRLSQQEGTQQCWEGTGLSSSIPSLSE